MPSHNFCHPGTKFFLANYSAKKHIVINIKILSFKDLVSMYPLRYALSISDPKFDNKKLTPPIDYLQNHLSSFLYCWWLVRLKMMVMIWREKKLGFRTKYYLSMNQCAITDEEMKWCETGVFWSKALFITRTPWFQRNSSGPLVKVDFTVVFYESLPHLTIGPAMQYYCIHVCSHWHWYSFLSSLSYHDHVYTSALTLSCTLFQMLVIIIYW